VASGLLLIRLVLGLTIAAHGAQKLFRSFGGQGPRGTAGLFEGLGFRAPLAMAVAAGIAEFGGGLLFATGLLTPLAALLIAVVMLNAIGTVHWRNGLRSPREETPRLLRDLTDALATWLPDHAESLRLRVGVHRYTMRPG
jgi:putative oxidoreductase